MLRRLPLFYCFAASALTALLAPAQTPDGQPSDQANPGSTGQKIFSSHHMAAALREKLPAYTALEEAKPEPVPEKANDTVILETRVIRSPKARTFTERELATQTGLAALLRKRYPGASIPVGSRRPNYAALMLADDERLEHIAELESVAENLRAVGDVQASKDLKKEISRSFMRRTDWRTESLDRSANNNRR